MMKRDKKCWFYRAEFFLSAAELFSLSGRIILKRVGNTGRGVGPGTTHVHKITNVPVVYMGCDIMSFMRANRFRGPLEGVGPENLDFFGPKWHSLRS